MNRRNLIFATAVVAVAVFAAAVYLYAPSKEGAPAVAANGAPLVRDHSPVLGPIDAPVTIVEFFDPACEACRAFYPYVKQIMAAFPDKVRVVLRYATFHGPSEEAVRILEAARRQGKFTPVLERLLLRQSEWAPHGRPAPSPWTMLAATGLDVDVARKDAQRPDVEEVLRIDAADIKEVGVRRTPTFYVNGKPLTEFGPQQLHDLVEREVEAAGR